ncbi:MAG: beta-propeller domain-containing protein [Actinobacteria bacterium]|nr:beta-propeller domain-containing protein [Actinomycetota bacterium]
MDFRRRLGLLLGLAVLVAIAGGSADRSAAEGSRSDSVAKAGRLVQFGSCGDLLGYVKPRAARFVGPFGFGGGVISDTGGIPIPAPAASPAARTAAPQQGVDYSGTNVQEEGVDEPDLVKTNGTTLFTVGSGRLNAVDVSDQRPRLLDTLKLDGGWSHELLLYGDRLLVLSRGGYFIEPLPAMASVVRPWMPAESVLAEIDVSNPKALRVVRTLTLDGSYVAARLVGGSARIVTASQVPSELPFEQPKSSTPAALAAARERNQAIVASSKVGSWLPSYQIKRPGRAATARRPLVQCRKVRRPPEFSGLGMLTVLTVDLAKGLEPVSSVAVMTDARIVYASPESLYVATERWADRPDPDAPEEEQNGVSTAIHKFDISSPERALYRGSGRVSGYLLSQWSLSEHRGVLRVVSTETPAWWGPGGDSESFLTTLRQQGGSLVQAGRIGNLGKGERVYAVRFVGDVGYIVTFRQIDPLYTVDLADPDRPRVLGELKIPGYSAYLHPIGEDLLLGIGQDATEEGRPLGTQVSIFDVSDLRRPTRLYKAALGLGWSEAESDHHAFLFWPRTGVVVIPFEQRAVAFRVGRARGIDELGRIDHAPENRWAAGIRRSLVVRDGVFTVSEAGVMSSSLATLAERGWAGFPPPVQKP